MVARADAGAAPLDRARAGRAPESGPGPARQRKNRKYNRREALAGYLFISPWIVGFLVFTAGAMIYSLVISFSNYNLATNSGTPAGFGNYAELFDDPKVALSLGNTLFYAVLAVPLEIIVALSLAMLLAKVGRGAGIFRTIYYLPKMTPSVATASVFLLLLNGNTGAINNALRFFGIPGPQWLIDPNWVKPSIVLMTLWGVSGTMVIFLAALKNVPRELYEVASIDGAGAVRRFFSITVPMISGAIFFNVIVLTIAALQVFDQAYLLFWRDQTSSSPAASLFYGVYLFQQAFRQFDFGFASAMAWLLFVIILLITLVQVKLSNRFVYYEADR
ncbi:carbohydrate ABC transporter permease [Cryobacterium tepidiphilum]|uniref:Sugar ABC transporter permease n=1 Tax=Cryobacterium tepidiphilum TaxID=2486026 RepID=A0A3M8L9L1_9MICO|nr:sugar ABC transporter permease [Cryobacterium tepidiphilum]RNE62193.1 sugar ABC transporter permease [Cryobacterium tepidiphilum]